MATVRELMRHAGRRWTLEDADEPAQGTPLMKAGSEPDGIPRQRADRAGLSGHPTQGTRSSARHCQTDYGKDVQKAWTPMRQGLSAAQHRASSSSDKTHPGPIVHLHQAVNPITYGDMNYAP
jgi:hypothetical protein